VSCNGLSSNADTLIDTAASIKFVSKFFAMTNGFCKDCKTIPKLSIRLPSEHRISTTNKVCCTTVFTNDENEFTDLQFRALPDFKGSAIILGLSTLKKLEVAIHANLISFTMKD